MSLANPTPRQRNVPFLVPTGLTDRQIGDQLGMTESVLKNYLKEVYGRLGI
jgi:DNA-binding NarL/FixJ family response regulator